MSWLAPCSYAGRVSQVRFTEESSVASLGLSRMCCFSKMFMSICIAFRALRSHHTRRGCAVVRATPTPLQLRCCPSPSRMGRGVRLIPNKKTRRAEARRVNNCSIELSQTQSS